MATTDPLFDLKNSYHQQKRAQGQLYKGPIQRDGYINNTKKIVVHESPFADSIEPMMYTYNPLPRYKSSKELKGAHDIKFVSQYMGDDL